jgi:proton-dependent oligopeptide transporter, POT family
VTDLLVDAAEKVSAAFAEDQKLPATLENLPDDPWGNPLLYEFVHANEARITSHGPDQKPKTQWDLGLTISVNGADEEGKETWLYKAKERLGLLKENTDPGNPLSFTRTAGGGVKLEGAAYFWFFTKLMLVTAIAFVPFAIFYKPRTYLQDVAEEEEEEAEARAEGSR